MTIDLEAPEIKAAVTAAAEKIAQEKIDAETGGLKNKNNELMDELKGFKKKFEGVDPDDYKKLKGEKRTKEDADSDPVKLRERIEGELTPKLTAAEQRAADAEAKLTNHIIDSQLTNALVEGGVAKEFIRAVKADLSSSRKVEVVDGNAVIDGKPAADFVKAWAAVDGKAFIAAGNHSGGGAGGGGGGAVTKKMSEMTNADKATFIKEHGLAEWQKKVNNESK